jgi:hypothetical protein
MAAGANVLLNNLCVYFFKIPLYLDTVLNAAVCFAAGLIPGIVTALLTHSVLAIRDGGFHPFILCSIVEVFIIYLLRPRQDKARRDSGGHKTAAATLAGVFARLMLLYIVCSLAVSLLGGMIDFFYHYRWSLPKVYFSAEDTVKIGLLRSNIPVLAMNILSRIPVNIVDRFIVIFGGYFIARGLNIRFLKTA